MIRADVIVDPRLVQALERDQHLLKSRVALMGKRRKKREQEGSCGKGKEVLFVTPKPEDQLST